MQKVTMHMNRVKKQDLNQIKSIHIETPTCICTLRDQHTNNKAILAINSFFTWFYIFFLTEMSFLTQDWMNFLCFMYFFVQYTLTKWKIPIFLKCNSQISAYKKPEKRIFIEITMQTVRYSEKSHKYGSMS